MLTPADLARLKALVVDDHPVTARLVCDVLRAAGVGQVMTAGDGLRAREIIRNWDPHIVFTDWNMPVMDGPALTRSIRKAAVKPDRMVPNPRVPVIMLTAMRSRAEVEGARLAGVNEFVIKPFTPAALISRIQLVLKRPRRFIVSASYVGPCRRRKLELGYAGPLRRANDPDERAAALESSVTRETMGVELETLERLIANRGGQDRQVLQMTYRVLHSSRARAKLVRDAMMSELSQLLIDYADAMGGPGACDPAVLALHFGAIRTLLAAPEANEALAGEVIDGLKLAIEKKVAQRGLAA